MPKRFCQTCGQRIRNRNYRTICLDCLIKETYKGRQPNNEKSMLTNQIATEEEEPTEEEPTEEETPEETSEESVEADE